jgi:hypothetical protein
MASFNLLLNALKVHELLLRSRPGVKLSKADLSRRAEISEKQVEYCLNFLRKIGHPFAWDDLRWHESEASEGELQLMTLVPRLKTLPSKNIALLLMIQQGMDSLKGTPFWASLKILQRAKRRGHFHHRLASERNFFFPAAAAGME